MLNRQAYTLLPDVSAAVASSLSEWRQNDKTSRIWHRVSSLWTDADEGAWLGWLDIADDMLATPTI